MKQKILNTKLLHDQIALFYLGQVGFIVKWQNKYLLIDAYLSDYVDKNCCSDNVKWVRKYSAPIKAEELDFIDYVFCTHEHFDHADPDTLSTMAQINKKAKYVMSKSIINTIASYGVPKESIIGLSCDQKTLLEDNIFVTAIPSAHEELHIDQNGDYMEVGFKIELGKIVFYHAGDGCPYCGLEERITNCDIMMIPINGRDYYRTHVCDIIGCFNSREAVLLAKSTQVDLLIPTHFDLYDVNCANPAEFVDSIKTLNSTQKFHIFAPGEKFIYSK